MAATDVPREERRLQRQRGAAKREVKNADGFEISLPDTHGELNLSTRSSKRRKTLGPDRSLTPSTSRLNQSRRRTRNEPRADKVDEAQHFSNSLHADVSDEGPQDAENALPAEQSQEGQQNQDEQTVEDEEDALNIGAGVTRIMDDEPQLPPRSPRLGKTPSTTASKKRKWIHEKDTAAEAMMDIPEPAQQDFSAFSGVELDLSNGDLPALDEPTLTGFIARMTPGRRSHHKPVKEVLEQLENMSDGLRLQIEEVTNEILAEDEAQQASVSQEDDQSRDVEEPAKEDEPTQPLPKPRKHRKKRRCIGQNYKPKRGPRPPKKALQSPSGALPKATSADQASPSASSPSSLKSNPKPQPPARKKNPTRRPSNPTHPSLPTDPLLPITLNHTAPTLLTFPYPTYSPPAILPTDTLSQITAELLAILSAHPRITTAAAREAVTRYSTLLQQRLAGIGTKLALRQALEGRIEAARVEQERLKAAIAEARVKFEEEERKEKEQREEQLKEREAQEMRGEKKQAAEEEERKGQEQKNQKEAQEEPRVETEQEKKDRRIKELLRGIRGAVKRGWGKEGVDIDIAHKAVGLGERCIVMKGKG